MALIDETYLRETFPIHGDVNDKRITPYLAIASRRLKKWVGATNYGNSELADELKLAEGNLAMHFLTLNLNTAIRPEGMVKSEQVEGEKTVQYFSPGETQNFAQQFLDQADEIVREIIADASQSSAIEVILGCLP